MTALYIAVLLVGGWFLIPFALRHVAEARLRAACRARRAIVLSYDDGPSCHLLPRLLDLLAAQRAKATFFLLGRNLESNSSEVERLQNDGHEIGGHTFDHSNAWKSWPGKAGRDLRRGQDVLRAHGLAGSLFRPPYGKSTLATLLECRRHGLRLGWWTIDSRDSWARRPIPEVIGLIGAQGGGVVLMHDRDTLESPDGPTHPEYVLELTRGILEYARENGFQIRRLGDVLGGADGGTA